MEFTKQFTSSDSIPKEGIENAIKLMQQGELYRYAYGNLAVEDEESLVGEVARLEAEFSRYTGHKYAVAVNSCGSAMFLALKAAGVKYDDKVFTNAFSFTAVPSSIIHAGGIPVYVECNRQYIIDLDDFAAKIEANPDTKYFLLSHMRGHISDLDKIKELCDRAGIFLIEDCAHSLGAQWYHQKLEKYKQTGHHSKIACFSTQSYKLLNSGEGGFVATDDEEIAVYCTLAAGSYEKYYKKHISVPSDELLFENLKLNVPNFSMRMSNLTAAVLRAQIKFLPEKIAEYNEKYNQLVNLLSHVKNIEIPPPLPEVFRVGSSIQFNLIGLDISEIQEFISNLTQKGIKIQIFGHEDNSRYFRNWRYSFKELPELQQTESILSAACDVRLPLSFDSDDINLLGYIIKDTLYKILKKENRVDYKEGLTDNFSGIKEVISKYDDWISFYDKEHKDNGWQILLNDIAYTLKNYLANNAKTLDVGCGTGLLGIELSSFGFDNLYGIDISEKSLNTAQKLDVYQGLELAELGKSIDFADNSFDALVSSGVFTRKQVPLNAFEELFRILKTDGIFALVLRVEDDGYYDNKLKEYCSKKVVVEVMRKRFSVLQSCNHDLVILKSLKL